jgi:hypothetical protein
MRRTIRYRRNAPIGGDAAFGRRVMDEVTGVWTREGRLVTDGDGFRVDPRLDGGMDSPDYRGKRPHAGGAP